MIFAYGIFGIFANIALLANLLMLIAIMSVAGFTLTLPGIAGIVLTMGMAVDSNVLIYERIREEWRNGRTALNAIETGFKVALATILDFEHHVVHRRGRSVRRRFGSGARLCRDPCHRHSHHHVHRLHANPPDRGLLGQADQAEGNSALGGSTSCSSQSASFLTTPKSRSCG